MDTPLRSSLSRPVAIDSDRSSPDEPPLRVMALHALLYCERLFYLEEVEEIRVADGAVYAGRRLHDDVVPLDDESPEHRSVDVASDEWGILGKVDAVRRRDGIWVAYEHKRGRCRRGEQNEPQAWPSDRIQAIAYAVLLEEELQEAVPQARIRYHADRVTAFVTIDKSARQDLRSAVTRARELRRTTARPPVAENERLCLRCSLAPVCLPEEERLPAGQSTESPEVDTAALPHTPSVPTLFPSNRERHTLHIVSPRSYVSRSHETLVVKTEDEKQTVPIQQVDAVVLHGYGQMTTQALHLCAYHGVAVMWMTAGGKFSAATSASPGRVQQRIRQYRGLTNSETCLRLAQQLVRAKLESQLRYILRGTRGNAEARTACASELDRMREALKRIGQAGSLDTLRGLEGIGAKAYFAALHQLLSDRVPPELRPIGRSKHPPRDRFNCLLSFAYGMLHGLVHRTLLAVGLEPAFGFFHQPRSAAAPLVLDVMEIFRTPLADMPIVGSVNRGQWQPDEDFVTTRGHIWLSDSGRKKAIGLFEQRLEESYKHPYTGQSLSYSRMVELEVRLLEKEWSGAPGLFAQLRMR